MNYSTLSSAEAEVGVYNIFCDICSGEFLRCPDLQFVLSIFNPAIIYLSQAFVYLQNILFYISNSLKCLILCIDFYFFFKSMFTL